MGRAVVQAVAREQGVPRSGAAAWSATLRARYASLKQRVLRPTRRDQEDLSNAFLLDELVRAGSGLKLPLGGSPAVVTPPKEASPSLAKKFPWAASASSAALSAAKDGSRKGAAAKAGKEAKKETSCTKKRSASPLSGFFKSAPLKPGSPPQPQCSPRLWVAPKRARCGRWGGSVPAGKCVVNPLEKFKSYRAVGVLGRGSFGIVTLAEHREGAKYAPLALKSIAIESLASSKKVVHALEERRALETLRGGPNIVRLEGAWRSQRALHVLTQCCVGGELFAHLQKRKRFEPLEVRFIAAELTCALLHTHAHWIVYRDLKPENVLFDERGHVVLADFGLAKKVVFQHGKSPSMALLHRQGCSSLCGTPEYIAPEILDRQEYGAAVDWWSLGIVVAELATGLPPWYTADRTELFRRIRSAPLELRHAVPPPRQKTPTAKPAAASASSPRSPAASSPGVAPPRSGAAPLHSPEALMLAAFVSALLRRNVDARLRDETVKSAPFFSGVRWATLAQQEPPFNPMRQADGRLKSPQQAVLDHFSSDRATEPLPLQHVEPPPPPPPEDGRDGAHVAFRPDPQLFRGWTFAAASPTSPHAKPLQDANRQDHRRPAQHKNLLSLRQ
ncbi:kinase-like domain-containing protein [Pelagophyceae sp. CCMP2097]|nr:kinase-like domain-containing protein [Pelagophyceae sp. CCMP2097]